MDFYNAHQSPQNAHHDVSALTHTLSIPLDQEVYNAFPNDTFSTHPHHMPHPLAAYSYHPNGLATTSAPATVPGFAAATTAPQSAISVASSGSFVPPTPPIQSHTEHTPPIQQFATAPGDQTPIQGFQGMTPPGQIHGLAVAHQVQQQGQSGILGGMTMKEDEVLRRGGSNSEDEDLTPAQSRRKAQNRAAQRAFRERKERHVKDLEVKLAILEESSKRTASENEILKRNYEKVSVENKILRATGEAIANYGPGQTSVPEQTTTGPQTYNPDAFYETMLAKHPNKQRSHRVVVTQDGERLLAAAATWDYIVSHEKFKMGMVNPQDVSDRLKNQARCDGQGPVFKESDVEKAIDESVKEADDEML